MKKTSKINNYVKTQKEFELRKEFLNVYGEFDNWLRSIGFNSSESILNGEEPFIKEYLTQSSYGMEIHTHDVLNLEIYFARDHFEHKILYLNEFDDYFKKEVLSLEEFTKKIIELADNKRKSELSRLNFIKITDLVLSNKPKPKAGKVLKEGLKRQS